MRVPQVEKVERNRVCGSPSLCAAGSAQVLVADEIHQHKPGRDAIGSEELEVRDLRGQPVELRTPSLTAGPGPKPASHALQYKFGSCPGLPRWNRSGPAHLSKAAFRINQNDSAVWGHAKRVPTWSGCRPERIERTAQITVTDALQEVGAAILGELVGR
jgi:hypothetical protein